jgi:FdhE protein
MVVATAVQRRPRWSERIARAATLIQSVPAAAEILSVYQQLATFQKSLYGFLETCSYAPADAAGFSEPDWFLLLPRFEPLLHILQAAGPERLRHAVRELQSTGPAQWQNVLARSWRGERFGSEADELVAQAFLQPVAEYIANKADFPRDYFGDHCPFCERAPAVAVLRPEGDGAKRSLICSLCSTEWNFRRILCVGCAEERLDHLPIYTAEEFPYVRIEACDTCRQYIKAVDLTKNGFAVAIVDELATPALSLWAEEKGYRKLQPNLFGL